MNQMLTRIPYVGTARKAALDNGIVTGGKTGTTQAYRDAWFVGFTGNYTCAVWFGNDDYTSTNNMTGGSLPAMTFKRAMDYAHQGIDAAPHPRHRTTRCRRPRTPSRPSPPNRRTASPSSSAPACSRWNRQRSSRISAKS